MRGFLLWSTLFVAVVDRCEWVGGSSVSLSSMLAGVMPSHAVFADLKDFFRRHL